MQYSPHVSRSDGVITVGRNVGIEPMPAPYWRKFIGDIEQLIVRCDGLIYTTAYGLGDWNGVTEDTAVVTFGQVDTVRVLADLPALAAAYHQDAIAILLGGIQLVGPGEAHG